MTRIRSGLPETTIYGLIAVSLGDSTWTYGDASAIVWSRSLLKPWQWLSYAPELLTLGLTPEALAMITSSHQGEEAHQEILNQLKHELEARTMTLLCPAMPPMADMSQPESRWNHPCAGKHAGFMLTAQTLSMPIDSMLSAHHPLYQRLVALLSEWLPTWDGQQYTTVDGCGMPNWGFHPAELSELYRLLAQPSKDNAVATLQQLMLDYPALVGGTGRFDSALMNWPVVTDNANQQEPLRCWAKEGADGLLGIGIAPSKQYPKGIGILIKLAGGYHPEQFKPILAQLLSALNLSHPAAEPDETRLGIHASEYPFLESLKHYRPKGASTR